MIRWNIRTERDMTTAEFFSLPAIRAHLKGDGDRLRELAEARDADEMAEEQEEADERRQEMRDELRIEHDRQIDDDVRRAEADYLNPRN